MSYLTYNNTKLPVQLVSNFSLGFTTNPLILERDRVPCMMESFKHLVQQVSDPYLPGTLPGYLLDLCNCRCR